MTCSLAQPLYLQIISSPRPHQITFFRPPRTRPVPPRNPLIPSSLAFNSKPVVAEEMAVSTPFGSNSRQPSVVSSMGSEAKALRRPGYNPPLGATIEDNI